ncbi:MAG: glycerophosphodiester phosphodiesterase family protein [Clostridia bacterium]|nr:glycerophosphodiester phosphodiesterase family protein [Clostridia bacterium]
MMKSIQDIVKEKGIMIVAHRGVAGGNLPCNTPESYEGAILQGADMVELDVSISRDGKLFVFHPGMEPAHLKSEKLIADMDATEVEQLRFYNMDDAETHYGVSYLKDVLKQLKGRILINIDKYWTCMEEITALVRELGMEQQVLVKLFADQTEEIEKMEQVAPDIPFMVLVKHTDEITDTLLQKNVNYIGTEVLFETDTAPVASKEYVEEMHKKGLLVWMNAIVYNEKDVISGGHTDDISVAGNPDEGWGWIGARGADIVQTDWPQMAITYYEKTGKRTK